MKLKQYIVLLLVVCNIACKSNGNTQNANLTDSITPITAPYPLSKLQLPPGFNISIFAKVENARSMCIGTHGTIFVGTRSEDKVYALVDENKDGQAEKTYVIAEGLNMPNGVAFKDGNLYIAEVSRILRIDNIEQSLANPPKPVVVFANYPKETHHGWKFIAFGTDGKLYVPVGAPCNVCERKDSIYASITRLNPDGSGLEIVAHGVRNTVGFAWHPQTGELWFTDNGRDMMGDDMPFCELNRLSQKGEHFGFPYVHQGDVLDPQWGKGKDPANYTAPALKVGPHVAPLGMRFYTGNMFPKAYQNNIFIAEHGSWNRSKKAGYKVGLATLEANKVIKYQPFVEGFLQPGDEVLGRPVDLLQLPDGSMLLSDDFAGLIYRITYKQ
jgi:glucose/arabinose dehydrogenase